MPSRVELWVDPAGGSSGLCAVFAHTTICVIFDNDFKYLFSYNEHGLSKFPATDETLPASVVQLGETNKTLPEIIEYAQGLCDTEFKKYSAIGRNCNHFSNKLSVWLCNKNIPTKYLYQDVIATTQAAKAAIPLAVPVIVAGVILAPEVAVVGAAAAVVVGTQFVLNKMIPFRR